MDAFDPSPRSTRPARRSTARAGVARSRGFTLQELCVSLLISSALAAGGVGTWSLVRETAITAATNDLIAHLALARSEAIKRYARVVVCPSHDRVHCAKPDADYTFWQDGWLVYADENRNGKPEPGEIVRVQSGTAVRFVIRTSRFRRKVTYQPLGTAGGSTITFAVCGARDPARARYITISNPGRARVSRTTKSKVKCG